MATTHKHTHTVSLMIQRSMEPRARIGINLHTCTRSPPLIKLMRYEHRDEVVGVGGAGNGNHTVSPVTYRVDGASGKDRMQP